ncbi:MAG: hypothetical protein J2P17_32865 [Mycobacterium sp.]|nr:hypothetical protein [Mycobacterium sp.]
MPIVVGVAIALWILLLLAAIGAVLVGGMVLSTIEDTLDRLRHDHAGSAWRPTPLDVDGEDDPRTVDDPDETEEWLSDSWSYRSPTDATAWWWSPGGSSTEMVIDARHTSGTTAVAEKHAATHNQIWTIHPDHSAHWQDEAGDCPWCRNEPV